MKYVLKMVSLFSIIFLLSGCGRQCTKWITKTEDPCGSYTKYKEACEAAHGGKKTIKECVEWK